MCYNVGSPYGLYGVPIHILCLYDQMWLIGYVFVSGIYPRDIDITLSRDFLHSAVRSAIVSAILSFSYRVA